MLSPEDFKIYKKVNTSLFCVQRTGGGSLPDSMKNAMWTKPALAQKAIEDYVRRQNEIDAKTKAAQEQAEKDWQEQLAHAAEMEKKNAEVKAAKERARQEAEEEAAKAVEEGKKEDASAKTRSRKPKAEG